MSETRTRRRIRKAVESRGYSVKHLDYEAPYDAGEKMGLGGGWWLILDRPYVPNTFPGDDLGGLSVDELVAQIDVWLRPTEPCGCDQGIRWGDHPRDPTHPLKGDPQTTLHEPDCRWYLGYHMRWWKP